MTTIRATALALAAIISAGALAGCGSSGGGGNRLSRAKYIGEADRRCNQANKLPTPRPPKNLAEAASQAAREAKIRGDIVNDLAKLRPPKDLEDRVNAYLDSSREVVASFRKQSMSAGDFAAYQRETFRTNELLSKRGKISQDVGYRVCGAPPPGVDPSKFDEQLIAKADAQCRAADDAVLAVFGRKPYDPRDPAAASRFYARSYPQGKATLPKLGALKPSAEAKPEWTRFLAAYRERMAITGRQQAAANRRDRRALAAAGRDDVAAQKREAEAANKLGLDVCGQNGTQGV